MSIISLIILFKCKSFFSELSPDYSFLIFGLMTWVILEGIVRVGYSVVINNLYKKLKNYFLNKLKDRSYVTPIFYELEVLSDNYNF